MNAVRHIKGAFFLRDDVEIRITVKIDHPDAVFLLNFIQHIHHIGIRLAFVIGVRIKNDRAVPGIRYVRDYRFDGSAYRGNVVVRNSICSHFPQRFLLSGIIRRKLAYEQIERPTLIYFFKAAKIGIHSIHKGSAADGFLAKCRSISLGDVFGKSRVHRTRPISHGRAKV